MGSALHLMGRAREAQQYLERVIGTPAAPGDRRDTIYFNSNVHAAARVMLARALWMQGFTEQAFNEARLSQEELHGKDQQLLLCRTLYHGICRIALMTGDFATADREIDRTGWHISYPEFKSALASGLAGTGRLDEALVAVDEAMAADHDGADGRGWYAPELHRIKGEVLLQQAADQSVLAAEDWFDQAAQLAREQGALFWELRIALSVARLRVSQGRQHEARAPLAAVYDRFTEGFATADLQAARILLEALPP
jgi:hypothetical protein